MLNQCCNLALKVFLALLVATANANAVTILPVGDSITEGYSGQCSYRRPLAEMLFQDYGCPVQFTGSRLTPRNNPSRCVATNTPHEGRSFLTVNDLIDPMATAMQAEHSDYLLVHLGSNDLFYGDSPEVIVDDLELLIDRAREINSEVGILLAGIIPWDPTRGFDNVSLDELQLSNDTAVAIRQLVNDRPGEQIYFVDANTGFDSITMTDDGVHPNDLGEEFVASRFLTVLNSLGVCDSPAGDSAFVARLENANTGNCLEMPQSSSSAGDEAASAQCSAAANQQLLFEPVADATDVYTIQFQHSQASDLCLDASGAALAQQVCDNSDNQQFHISVEATRYLLTANDRVFGEAGDGDIVVADDNSQLSQRWHFGNYLSSADPAACDPSVSSREIGNPGEWNLLSLPCNAPAGATMADLIDDPALAANPDEWAAFRYQASGADAGYRPIAAGDPLPEPGVGFWFASTRQVMLRMPAGSVVSAGSNALPCAAGEPCHRMEIDHQTGWNMIGNPSASNLLHAEVQVVNDSTTCSVNSTCSLDGIAEVNSGLFSYNGIAYREFSSAVGKQNIAMPWEAYWVALQVEAGSDLTIDSPWQLYFREYSSQYVFVTSSHVDAAMGGIDGADALCQADASRAGLPGNYKAWLADSTVSPASVWSKPDRPYVRTDGRLVATSYNDLADNTLLNPINKTAWRVSKAATDVWTNTAPAGAAQSMTAHCGNWQNTVGSAAGGRSSQTGVGWTASGNAFSCSSLLPLYCGQQ